MNWSKNVKNPPQLIDDNEYEYEPSEMVLPYQNTDPNEENYIKIKNNEVTFKLQCGSAKQYGVNGCHLNDLLVFVLNIIRSKDYLFNHRGDNMAITKLEEALLWLGTRKEY
jgi:hypothetical protein